MTASFIENITSSRFIIIYILYLLKRISYNFILLLFFMTSALKEIILVAIENIAETLNSLLRFPKDVRHWIDSPIPDEVLEEVSIKEGHRR